MYETYKCPICKAEFQTPEELRVHRMTQHKVQNYQTKTDMV
ncbi:MAG: C2H2-type zinc finger protein [Candidatus Bathyarchaeota archaeon]|nr:C2H2-type zinc finger protein [Candidatus Bathyarchaeota archaeon]